MTAKTDACGGGSTLGLIPSPPPVVATEKMDATLPAVLDSTGSAGGGRKNNMNAHLSMSSSRSSTKKESKLKKKAKKKVKRVMQERWVCDVCKVKSFLEFDEACAHEEECRRLQQQKKEGTHDAGSVVKVISIDSKEKETKKQASLVNDSKKGERVTSVTPSPPIENEPPPYLMGDKKEADSPTTQPNKIKDVEKRSYGRRSSRIAAASAKPTLSISGKTTTVERKSRSNDDTGNKGKKKSRQRTMALSKVDQKRKSKTAKTIVLTKKINAISTPPKTKKINSASTTPPKLASIFSRKSPTADAIIAEHRAADFFAKRKLERDAERERERKREEQKRKNGECAGQKEKGGDNPSVFFRGSTPCGAIDVDEGDSLRNVMAALKAVPGKKASTSSASVVLPVAPRFPVPNHILGQVISEKKIKEDEANDLSHGNYFSGETWLEALEKLRKTEKFQALSPTQTPEVAAIGAKPVKQGQSLLEIGTGQSNQRGAVNKTERDALYHAFSSVLIPPAVEIGDSHSNDDDSPGSSSQLWCDKYTIQRIPQDVCGEDNKETAEKLVKFINEWREHRNQALRRREKEGKKSRKGNKRSQRKREYYSWNDPDDELFCDSDDEDGLCSVFVLTGPTGSGKTALVNAAAEQCECVTLEINTTEKRGGQALKRAIEESTQSHSSLALLKRENSALIADEEDPRSDTEDEDGEDDFESDEDTEGDISDDSRGEGCFGKKGPSLALVLIDEVDNLFESNGDAGFWSALGQLTKKAKCPIILTATAVPQPLYNSSTIRFECASLVRPTPMECAARMCYVAKMEGMKWRRTDSFSPNDSDNDDGDDFKEGLCHVAKLCRCDLRRIYNEMHSFSFASVATLARPLLQTDGCKLEKRCRDINMELKMPFIKELSPRLIPSSGLSVVTIRGTNFQKAVQQFQKCAPLDSKSRCGGIKLEVKIGDRPSPAFQVVDDNTIIAVCPMSHIPPGVNSSGVFENSFEDCLTCRYEPISIRVTGTGGIVVHSDMSRSEESSDADISLLDGPRAWNVEYDFPSMDYELETVSRIKDERKRKHGKDSGPEENVGEYFSSSDDDFVSPKKRKLHESEQVTSGVRNVKTMVNGVPPRASVNVVPETLLKKSVKDFTSKSGGPLSMKVGEENPGFYCPLKNSQGIGLTDMDIIAKRMELDSDAALLEDAFCNSIPLLSGPVSGFGTDLLEESAAMSQRKGNAKPPSIEKLYASGWNDSSFFFGSNNTYMTYPRGMRDKQILSWSEANMRGMSRSTADCSCPVESSEVGALSNVAESQDISHESKNMQTQEDMFFPPSIPNPITSLPRIIRSSNLGDTLPSGTQNGTSDIFLLQQTKEDRTMRMLQLAFPITPDVSKMNTFSFGVSFDKDCADTTNHAVSKRVHIGEDLDSRFFLDYLPYLRRMAAFEAVAERTHSENMQGENNDSETRRSSRLRNRGGRKHYFEKLTSGSRKEFLDKKTGAHLAKMILSYNQTSSIR